MKRFFGSSLVPSASEMCYRLVERYAVCHCLYFIHAVDPCVLYGYKGHSTTDRILLVGYLCSYHSRLGYEGMIRRNLGRSGKNNDNESSGDERGEREEHGQEDTHEDNGSVNSSISNNAGMSEPLLQAADSRTADPGKSNDAQGNRALPDRRRISFAKIFPVLPWLSRVFGR